MGGAAMLSGLGASGATPQYQAQQQQMMQTHQAYMQQQQQQFLQAPQAQQPGAMAGSAGNDGSMLARLRAASQSREARGTLGLGSISGIAPDESEMFLSRAEQQALFGPTMIKPDQMKIPMSQAGNFPMMTAENMAGYAQMQGEFKIERGFAGMDRAQMFSVCNPQKAKGGDYIQYTVFGFDKLGKFEIFRRYSDFAVLRELFVERWPGLYIPPLPGKRKVGNTKVEFVEERCFLLNMFIRQLARCPYLAESEEFYIFVRPSQVNLQRELALLPRLAPEAHLHRIQAYFSFIGGISDSQIMGQNNQIMNFAAQASKMLEFLNRFKAHIDQMEGDFEQALWSSQQMNGMLRTYEATLIESYGDGKKRARPLGQGPGQVSDYDDHYMVFEAVQNADMRTELEELPTKMQNPFTVMRRWLKFELLDLQAILEAIKKKNEMEKRRQAKVTQRNEEKEELWKMKEGQSTLRSFFMGKDAKINRITELTNSVGSAEKDIECLSLLHKIIVLQLNQAAIQFFKRDKFTTYNHTVNLYAAKQIENNTIRMDVFQKVNQLNNATLNQYEEKKRMEESTDQTRVAEKLRPATEEGITQPPKQKREPQRRDGGEEESNRPVRDGGYMNADTSAHPEMLLEDLQREVAADQPAEDAASAFGRSEQVDGAERSALLRYDIAEAEDGDVIDGLGAGREVNPLMQSERRPDSATLKKNTEVEIPIEANRSVRVE